MIAAGVESMRHATRWSTGSWACRGSYMSFLEDCLLQLARGLEGKKTVIIGYRLDACESIAETIRNFTGEPPFVLARGSGSRLPPRTPDFGLHVIPISAADYATEVRLYEATLSNLPSNALDALQDYDPAGEALVLGRASAPLDSVAGRRAFAPTRDEWVALEDKGVVDAFWDRVGIGHAPSEVIPSMESARLLQASKMLRSSLGVIWSGDASKGPNSGAELIRWVRSEEHAHEAMAFFRTRCNAVRVMPFLRGTPCAVHGIVFDHGTAAFRPVETMTGHRPGTTRLYYCGTATFWLPSQLAMKRVRTTVRRVGEYLRQSLDYRGGFSIDGVMVGDTFMPTEINTRFTGGHERLAMSCPELPLELLNAAAIARQQLSIEIDELETYVIEAANRNPTGSVYFSSKTCVTNTSFYETECGTMSLGPSVTGGGFARLDLDPTAFHLGESVAAQAFRALRAKLATLGVNDADYVAIVDCFSGPDRHADGV